MNIAITALGVVLSAFAVWLGVRIDNRRERWAKRTAAALVALLVGYPLSFGPAVLLSRRGLMPSFGEELFVWIYLPLAVIAPLLPEPLKGSFDWYVNAWR
jgi:hypothetical protein